MEPIFVLFNITAKILDDNIVEFINNNANTEILVDGIMKIDNDGDDQFGNLVVKFGDNIDFKAFLISWKLANPYELRYFICKGSAEFIYKTFHVEEISE